MAERLDAMVCREGKDSKKYWTKIGSAFPNRQGGWNITLDALPVDGKICLFPPRERGQQPQRQEPKPAASGYSDAEYGAGGGSGNPDDDIPF